ncbi:hypothetical protein [Acinetobacter bereziniae]|uniref:hypothetical protein n=1 Tax=Acinetobacter bereziniae TaxID=106648 RepID=UPI001116B31F|nr:hypothetical protein EYY58_21005 [Acinetobacter bereziniae]
MNFSANINTSKKLKLVVVLVFSLTATSVLAELIQTPDRLEQLSKTFSQNTYNPEELDLPASAKLNVNLQEKNDTENLLTVKPEDYSRLKIKPLYTDSVIMYNENSRDYLEVRDFQNNIWMIYNIDKNYLTVLDKDEDEPTEESWVVGCFKDRITDKKTCFLNKYEFGILKSSKDGLVISVSKESKDLNLREYNYIRIDKKPAHKTRGFFTGQSAINIINEMKVGKTAYTRFYEWDSNKYEEIIPLWGFSVAYDVMNKMYSRLR